MNKLYDKQKEETDEQIEQVEEEEKEDKKKYLLLLLLLLLFFFIGLIIFIYPFVSRWYINTHTEDTIKKFNDERQSFIDRLPDSKPDKYEKDDDTYVDDDGILRGEIPEEQQYLDELYQYMYQTNLYLHETKQKDLVDVSSYSIPGVDLSKYGVKSGVVGQIEIEKINVDLPLSLGVNDAVLDVGFGHLTQTSYPIGGENTNCVVSAHRGHAGSDMLRYIDKLEPGDKIKVTNFWYVMEYEVKEIRVIAIDDVESVLIQEGRDMLTIYTCHPYGINSERYVVYCERVK